MLCNKGGGIYIPQDCSCHSYSLSEIKKRGEAATAVSGEGGLVQRLKTKQQWLNFGSAVSIGGGERWNVVFANTRQGRGRKAQNPKPSHRPRFQVCHIIKQRWREAVGGGGATHTM
jgi:hypothetical protein